MPERTSLAAIDARWDEMKASNPRLFDGPCWHVLGMHRNGHGGAAVHVMRSSYRFHAVQDDEFDAGFRGLGVRAITRRGSEILLGRRAEFLLRYAGLWEFVPAGKLEPGADPAAMIVQELAEETGLHAAFAPAAIAVVFDPIARSWQIVYRINVRPDPPFKNSEEHSEMRWLAPDSLPGDLSPVDRLMTELLSPEPSNPS